MVHPDQNEKHQSLYMIILAELGFTSVHSETQTSTQPILAKEKKKVIIKKLVFMHKPFPGERLSALMETKFGVAIFWPLRKKRQSPSCMQSRSNVNSAPLGTMQVGKGAEGFPTLRAAHWELGKQEFVN